ncbi:hypothetical protein BN159_1711 [Streptomyces davaonensis JCM 4913]|uniref:HEAT repeat domain-containing protein n=1 Tax=Streptomyces davaonensis (strain DSM 101723 / JCM 4913 / KCC S-0913 / 768) TaxID=1214101 RepID=K4QZ18_STRDJ|nr:HEAT repeat domain-containing protein [Streptomyces davaonensis]CCK26090.1 hypothetical protein BN159_1711 [Streptomyces davaonensis JCM 4913]
MFFRGRGARERQQGLSARLASPEAAVRAAAAAEIAEERDWAWAVRKLARALDREPTPRTFDDIAGAFGDALRRDRATRQRIEHMFASHLDDPSSLVRDWIALLAEYGVETPATTVDDDLAEEVRGRLERLREQGWRHHELARMRPESFAYAVAFGTAVELLHESILRTAPLTAEEAERARAQARDAFERALPHPADSDERGDILLDLCELPDDESWTARSLAALRTEEVLALSQDADPDRSALGVEALEYLLAYWDDIPRRTVTRETLDRLSARDQPPLTLARVLRCYASMHNKRDLTDPPVDLFLTSLSHPDARVRAAAASGLDAFGGGSAEEARVVAALIEALEHDPDIAVVRSAAHSLALIVCSELANTLRASAALARKADAVDARVRAASVEGALFRNEAGAFGRLVAEFERSDVEPAFVEVVDFICGLQDSGATDEIRTELTRLLERLGRRDWPELPFEDDLYPDPEDRADLLEKTLETLRTPA